MGYERLSQEFKQKILAPHWTKHSAQVKEQYGYDLAEEGLELRHRVQTDGWWAGKNILGYTEFADCHKELFKEFYITKDPGASNFRAFAEADQGLHDRLLFLSRGAFKSRTDIVDCIQWFLCFTSIRISILTGTSLLAKEFVDEIKGRFKLNADGSPRNWEDGPLQGKLCLQQILFPEHCETKPGLQPEWVTPARSFDTGGPTLRAISLDTNTTGTHCDILKIDDGTNAENTENAERIKKVNKQISMARKLCEPYGYKDRIGTPYHPNDNLTSTVKDEEIRREKNLPPLVKVLIHPAYEPKPGFEDYSPDELTEDNVVLWFPERLTWKYLQNEYQETLKHDPSTFFSQFLLNLTKASSVKFRRDKMVAATIDSPPTTGVIFQAWDLAYSEKTGAKFTVGMAGLFAGGCIYVFDLLRDRYGDDVLPKIMASFAHKWKPSRVAVEDSMGARWLQSDIRQELARLGTQVPFEFVSLGKGSSENSKVNKARAAVRLLGDKRLFFCKSIPNLTELYNELEQFPNGTFTDQCCSLSLLVNHFGNFANMIAGTPVSLNDRQERLHYDRIYGRGQFAGQVIDQTLISAQGQSTYYDPLSDLY